MHARSRLQIVEMVLPAGDTPHSGKLLDLAMLVMPGGQERTAEEYRHAAGLRLTRLIPTTSSVSVVEAVAAN
jgi:O-methyltransferase domain